MKKIPKDVDAYIAAAPTEARSKLVQLRKIIKAAAPKADEVISYKVPYYKYHGALVYFAAFKNHIGFFVPPPIIEEHKLELKGYETAKATVRFPTGKASGAGIPPPAEPRRNFGFGCFQADTAKLICDLRFAAETGARPEWRKEFRELPQTRRRTGNAR